MKICILLGRKSRNTSSFSSSYLNLNLWLDRRSRTVLSTYCLFFWDGLIAQVKQRAVELSKAIGSEDGVEGAVKAFHKHFHQSRSLIVSNTKRGFSVRRLLHMSWSFCSSWWIQYISFFVIISVLASSMYRPYNFLIYFVLEVCVEWHRKLIRSRCTRKDTGTGIAWCSYEKAKSNGLLIELSFAATVALRIFAPSAMQHRAVPINTSHYPFPCTNFNPQYQNNP